MFLVYSFQNNNQQAERGAKEPEILLSCSLTTFAAAWLRMNTASALFSFQSANVGYEENPPSIHKEGKSWKISKEVKKERKRERTD